GRCNQLRGAVQSNAPPATVSELGIFAPGTRHLCTLNSAPLCLKLGHFPFQSRPLSMSFFVIHFLIVLIIWWSQKKYLLLQLK
ncbi:MAG: hypothetical protein IJP46_02095, partial [Prevotella sp.]|nr:hypothetical protein [Prevotella sp.]